MKYNTLVVAPVFTRSGYGEYAREVVRALRDDGRFDLTIAATKWGDTPPNAELSDVERWIIEEKKIGPITRQPDLLFQVTVPPEFFHPKVLQVRGRKNFGLTAGIEADRCPPDWIEGVNRTDVTFAMSKFAADSLRTEYKIQDGRSLKVERPIEVCGIGVDVETFRFAKRDQVLQARLDAIPENFLFLFVGHWLPGNMGEDRKDVARLVSLFAQTFAGNRKTALVMKTSGGHNSLSDRIEMTKRIEIIRSQVPNAPKVYLVHGDLTDREMSTLFRHVKVKAYVSLTHGEGFNIAPLQFALSGKPILLPGFSGHLDYLLKNYPTLPVEATDIPASGLPRGMVAPGAKWGTVNPQIAADAMRKVFTEYHAFLPIAKSQAEHVAGTWSREAVNRRFIRTVEKHITEVPFEEEIELPPSLKNSEEEIS